MVGKITGVILFFLCVAVGTVHVIADDEEYLEFLEEEQKAAAEQQKTDEFSEKTEMQRTLFEHKKAREERKEFEVTGEKESWFAGLYTEEEKAEEDEPDAEEKRVEKKQRPTMRTLVSSEKEDEVPVAADEILPDQE